MKEGGHREGLNVKRPIGQAVSGKAILGPKVTWLHTAYSFGGKRCIDFNRCGLHAFYALHVHLSGTTATPRPPPHTQCPCTVSSSLCRRPRYPRGQLGRLLSRVHHSVATRRMSSFNHHHCFRSVKGSFVWAERSKYPTRQV